MKYALKNTERMGEREKRDNFALPNSETGMGPDHFKHGSLQHEYV